MRDAHEVETPAQRRARSRVGCVLRGKWRLDSLLGVGGMAAVYAGTHRNGKRGAVKMLHLELSTDAAVRARFLREGYLANAVDHPGAVSVLDDDVAEDGSVFLVMELLEGQTLEGRAASTPGGRLSVVEVLAVTSQLLEVLAAAHARGIIHRDIKPENVFLTRHGQVKVLDFGLARLRDLPSVHRMTQTGTSMGTPAFMPPEQALGNWDAVDARSDLWATGATMFTLLTGRLVHEADTVNKLLLAAMTRPAPALRSVLPKVPSQVAALVDHALAFEPNDRWSAAVTMREAVGQTIAFLGRADLTGPPRATAPAAPDAERSGRHPQADGEGTSTLPPTSSEPARPIPSRSRVALVAIAGSLALVVAGLTVAARSLGRAAGDPPASAAPPAPSASSSPASPPPAPPSVATAPQAAAGSSEPPSPSTAGSSEPSVSAGLAASASALAPSPGPVPGAPAAGQPAAPPPRVATPPPGSPRSGAPAPVRRSAAGATSTPPDPLGKW